MNKLRVKRISKVIFGRLWQAVRRNPFAILGVAAWVVACLSLVEGLREGLPFDQRSYYILRAIVAYWVGDKFMYL